MKKILLLFSLGLVGKINAQICFGSASSYSVVASPFYPTEAIIADFNNDSKVDLVTGNSSGDVSILLGTGTGSFGNPTIISSTVYKTYADFNGDGNLDLAGANGTSVSLFFGNGAGGFSPAVNVGGHAGIYMISDDFNNDSKADLFVTDYYSDSTWVLLGSGLGGFSATVGFRADSNIVRIKSADFNLDGKMDIVTLGKKGLSVLLNSGLGNFTVTTILSSLNIYDVITEDFNGDSKPDLAVTLPDSSKISVLLGIGNGNFVSPNNFTTAHSPTRLVCADFNGDAKIDLATMNTFSVSILRGNGSGIFALDTSFNSGMAIPINLILSADFNGDNKSDLATTANVENIYITLGCTPTPTCIATVTDSLYKDSLPLTWDVVANYSIQVDSAKWFWGDGTSTVGLYPSHTYATSGWYNICVTVYTSCGDSASICSHDSIYRMTNNSMVQVNVLHNTNSVIEIKKDKNNLSICPNPTTTNLSITSTNELGTISIYNSLGEMVLQTKSLPTPNSSREGNSITIDLSKLSPGVYVIQSKDWRSKFIKE
jgi:hypothetical protein